MIELIDTLPNTDVQPAEYKRLLGYPRDRVLTERARELAQGARTWYAKHGQPWIYARQTDHLQLDGDASVVIDGQRFTSKRLVKTLQKAEAHGAILVAVSAGPELEAESQRLWLEEKPDEYFFLEIFGSAMVEHLITSAGARLCHWAEGQEMAVLPHYSPGYPEWDISDQPRLLDLIRRTQHHPLPGAIEVLDSGMLKPKKSLLAVFGLTRHVDRTKKLTDLVPCENCSFAACEFRRQPYKRSAEYTNVEAPIADDEQQEELAPEPQEIREPLKLDAKYATNAKALGRWSAERLTLTTHADGTTTAVFRYEGTTCRNMGRAVRFNYTVKLGPREEGYVIREQRCEPTPGDDGYTFMCRYMNNKEHLMVSIDHEKPLLGQRLDDVLAWDRPASGAGCYCEPTSRKHKWGIALETIHYALAQQEKKRLATVTTNAAS